MSAGDAGAAEPQAQQQQPQTPTQTPQQTAKPAPLRAEAGALQLNDTAEPLGASGAGAGASASASASASVSVPDPEPAPAAEPGPAITFASASAAETGSDATPSAAPAAQAQAQARAPPMAPSLSAGASPSASGVGAGGCASGLGAAYAYNGWGGWGARRTATADVAELIQSVQHELRTPVHGLLSLLEGLRKDVERSAAFNLPDAHPLLRGAARNTGSGSGAGGGKGAAGEKDKAKRATGRRRQQWSQHVKTRLFSSSASLPTVGQLNGSSGDASLSTGGADGSSFALSPSLSSSGGGAVRASVDELPPLPRITGEDVQQFARAASEDVQHFARAASEQARRAAQSVLDAVAGVGAARALSPGAASSAGAGAERRGEMPSLSAAQGDNPAIAAARRARAQDPPQTQEHAAPAPSAAPASDSAPAAPAAGPDAPAASAAASEAHTATSGEAQAPEGQGDAHTATPDDAHTETPDDAHTATSDDARTAASDDASTIKGEDAQAADSADAVKQTQDGAEKAPKAADADGTRTPVPVPMDAAGAPRSSADTGRTEPASQTDSAAQKDAPAAGGSADDAPAASPATSPSARARAVSSPGSDAAAGSASSSPSLAPEKPLSPSTVEDLLSILKEERRSLLSRLDGALGLVERLQHVLDDYNDFTSEILLADREAAAAAAAAAAADGAPNAPAFPSQPLWSPLDGFVDLAPASPAPGLNGTSSADAIAYPPPPPRSAPPMQASRSRSRILASASSSEREIDGAAAYRAALASPPPAPLGGAGAGAGPSHRIAHEQLDEPVNFGSLLDEVASEAWNAQVRALRAEDADARLPPPPELILQIDTSLRHVKSVASVSTVKKLMHKLISNSLRFTKEGYVEVSVMPGVQGEDTLDPTQAEADRYAQTERADEALQRESPPKTMNDLISIVVEDTGEGMTSSFMQENLFMPFQKAHQFRAGAGLSMTLVASLVRKLRGRMHIASDVGRGTIVTVTIPVVHHRDTDISPGQEIPPSNADRLVYLYGFEGLGMQRLAQAITAQLATFGNFYCTTSIKDCDYILLPEEKCIQTDGGAEAVLAQCRAGVMIGVLQAHEDAGIEKAAFLNLSRQPIFVTRKPFGPKAFEALLGAYNDAQLKKAVDGEVSGEGGAGDAQGKGGQNDYFSSPQKSAGGESGYSVGAGRMNGQALVGADSGSKNGDAGWEEGQEKTVDERTADEEMIKSAKRGKRGILADLLFDSPTMDAILRAPQARAPLLPVRRKIDSQGSEAARHSFSTAFPVFAGSMKSIMEGLSHMHQKITSQNFPSGMFPTPDEGAAATDADTKDADADKLDEKLPERAPVASAAKVAAAKAAAVVTVDPVREQAKEEASAFSVLCVEDNPLNMRVMTQMLKQSRILQFSAVDGVEAVEIFKEVRPSVVLLDINMPRMNGFEACEAMRKFEAEEREKHDDSVGPAQRIPSRIVAVTALSDDFHRQKGLDAGMDEWLTKPIKMNVIKQDLALWKEQWHQAIANATADDKAADAGASASGSGAASAPPA